MIYTTCLLPFAISPFIKDIGEEHEFYRRAWVEIGIMEMLEHYHNWLNS